MLFRPDERITDRFTQNGFTVSAEIIPPRNGTEQGAVLDSVKSLVSAGAQFISVTKGAGGSLRGGSLPIAQAVKELFQTSCIAHFTCRDLTPQDVENQLIDHHLFGIRNILALRGDPPQDQPNWQPQSGAYEYAYQLIRQIRALNQGEYLNRPSELSTRPAKPPKATAFCIGAAAYPEHPDPIERIEYFRLKVQAGAEYGITQMLYRPAAYRDFIEGLARANCTVPILPGLRLLRTQSQAQKMAARFGMGLDPGWVAKLPLERPDDPTGAQALDAHQGLIEAFKQAGAPGVHLFVLSDTKGSCDLMQKLAQKAL